MSQLIYLMKRPLSSAVMSLSAPLTTAVGQTLTGPFTKSLSSSALALCPHLSPALHQHKASPPSSEAASPYSKIPRTKTFLGLNTDILKDPTCFARYMQEQAEKLGPIYRIAGLPGLQEMVCLIEPKDVETAYRVGDASYPRRLPVPDWIKARKELNMPIGLELSDGEEWHKNRLPISKFIMMPRKMAEYHEPFNSVTTDYMKLIRAQRLQDNLFQDVTLSLNKWSLESVSLFVLGKRMGCLGDQMPQDSKDFVDSVHEFTAVSAQMLFGIPFHRLWRNKKWKRLINSLGSMFTYTEGHINQKIKEIEEASKDVAASDLHAEAGMDFLTYMIYSGKLSMPDIAMGAIDLLIAGIDTTALTMAASLYSLATNPEVQEKLRREVQDVVGKEEVVTPQHIQDMHYLKDVIKETMRLYPVAQNNARILSEDIVLSGFKVPAGTQLLMPITVAGRDPKLFPDPNSFKPERWDRGNKELPSSFSSIPFGHGRRGCVGRRVAELEMHILISQLVRNFKIEYREEKPMEFISKLFYGPARQMDLAFIDIN